MLGAKFTSIGEDTDLDSVKTDGKYFWGSWRYNPQNSPIQSAGMLYVSTAGSDTAFVVQTIIYNPKGSGTSSDPYVPHVVQRTWWVDHWSDWKEVSTAAFLNSYSSLAELASALGVGKRGTKEGGNFDFNELDEGITSYPTLVGCTNSPVSAAGGNRGIVITWRNTTAFAFQICYNQSSQFPKMFVRFGDGTASAIIWKNWKEVSTAS